MKSGSLNSYNFELIYLAELTRTKVKPLSRWEKPLNTKQHYFLNHRGFHIEKVLRRTLSGRELYETIFSTSSRYIDLYLRRFSNTLLNQNPETQAMEGFLFGFPSCCTRAFINQPYMTNSLPKNMQSLLFHWACPDCRITPELLPYYKKCFVNAVELEKEFFNSDFLIRENSSKQFSKKIQCALATLLLSAGLLSAQSISDSTHYIPLPDDANNNGLSYAEEVILGGYNLNVCEKYAAFFKSRIDSLPNEIQPDRVYKIEHLMWGLVECPKCGKSVNMGYITIINPLRNLQMNIPVLGLHFMEHGFFSYGDDSNYERISIDSLKKIIYPFDPEHLLPVENDTDRDGLADIEEDSLWIDYTSGYSDFNNNGNPDGVDLAEEVIRLFPKLSKDYDGIHSQVQFQDLRGIENCKICGSTHNMGSITIINPENNRRCEFPYLALHALAHGSFSYDGTEHENGHVNAVDLIRTAKTHMTHISSDSDNDGLTDTEETHFNLNPNNTDTDNNGIHDSKELAAGMVDIIDSLPTSMNSLGHYVERLDMDGVHICEVCGVVIRMGILNIYHPEFGPDNPFAITYYAYHFMQNGSFGCDGSNEPAKCPTDRIDPVLLSKYLNYPTGIDDKTKDGLPVKFKLEQNYPNPFNPVTKITFTIPYRKQSSDKVKHSVKLTVHNALGENIKDIFSGHLLPGKYEFEFNAKDLPSGIYLYSLRHGKQFLVRKMLLLK